MTLYTPLSLIFPLFCVYNFFFNEFSRHSLGAEDCWKNWVTLFTPLRMKKKKMVSTTKAVSTFDEFTYTRAGDTQRVTTLFLFFYAYHLAPVQQQKNVFTHERDKVFPSYFYIRARFTAIASSFSSRRFDLQRARNYMAAVVVRACSERRREPYHNCRALSFCTRSYISSRPATR